MLPTSVLAAALLTAGVDGSVLDPEPGPEAQQEPEASSTAVGSLGPMVGLAQIQDQSRFLYGFRGEWFVSPAVSIGTQGMTTTIPHDTGMPGTQPEGSDGAAAEARNELAWGGVFVTGHLFPRKRVSASAEAGLNWGLQGVIGDQTAVFLPHIATRLDVALTSWLQIAAGPSLKVLRGDQALYPGWTAVPGADLVVRFRVACQSAGEDHKRLGTLHLCV